MALILRLKPVVVVPALWLDRAEFDERFKADPRELLAAIPLDDFGGLPAMVQHVTFWNRGRLAPCADCGKRLPPEAFALSNKGRLRDVCRPCHAERMRRRASGKVALCR